MAGLLEMVPNASPNTLLVLQHAIDEATRRGHQLVGTEHVLCGLYGAQRAWPRVTPWMAERCGSTESDVAARVMALLNAKPMFQERAKAPEGTLGLSDSLARVVDIANKLGGGRVRDGDQVLEGGVVATEFVVAAIMVDGTGVAAEVIARATQGQVNSHNILQAIQADPAQFLGPRPDASWKRFALQPGPVTTPASKQSFFPTAPDAAKLPRAPIEESNWVFPDHLLVGAKPGYFNTERQELDALHKAGIRTFVCLLGEYSFSRFQQSYPATLGNMRLAEGAEFVFFPVADFDVVPAEKVVGVVLEVRRRLWAGERVYLHCRGGHGRTGLVTIPLVASLLDLDYDDARSLVLQCHNSNRVACGGYHCHMPETHEQERVAREAISILQQQHR